MAALHDLIKQISDPLLRDRITEEADKLLKQKKFGLVFEEHLPECTPLYDVPVRVGGLVALREGKISDLYTVLRIDGVTAVCVKDDDSTPIDAREQRTFRLDELVAAAKFGTAIYPSLTKIDSVSRAPDSPLWHTLIEAENYHALQLLQYLYAGQVDCIYIDPPYNTGAKDWKYNNDYVDANDMYRHSKWLSMMKKRLALAKKLLNPADSVLIVTIDEKEYLHLGCLLEEMFPNAQIQTISITINPSGAKRDNLFSRADEYIFFVLLGATHVVHPKGKSDEQEVRWWYLRRTDYSSRRGTVKGGTAQFYPIYVDDITKKIAHIGSPLLPEESIKSIPQFNGCTPVFPIREDGVEMNWGLTGDSLRKLIEQGVVRVTDGSDNQPYVFRYLSANYIEKIETGRWAVRGTRDDGTKIVVETEGKVTRATTVWQNKSHDAGQYGTSILKQLIGDGRFSFPKSLYAVHDTLRFFVANKPNALILDFFAGSGTTLHAVNLLNAEDGGNRRCILVTNNEVSADEAKSLTERGFKHGDEEWEKLGIARYVTWPRTVCSINGVDVNGAPLNGEYGVDREEYVSERVKITDDDGSTSSKTVYFKKKVPFYPELDGRLMSDGFEANAVYFKLGFLDKNAVSLGRQFRELLPVIWMKSGARGECPALIGDEIPDMLILPQNNFAVLTDEKAYAKFARRVKAEPDIDTIYIITDSDAGFRNMSAAFAGVRAFQLYRDYLDNFRINTKE